MLKAGIGQKDPEEPSGKKVRRKKKPLKMYLALAAVIVCVLAMGITSMGGPERIVRMMTQNVGDREVEYAVKGEKVKTIENEDEEKAYQEIRNNFGTDVVKNIYIVCQRCILIRWNWIKTNRWQICTIIIIIKQ